MRLGWYTWSVMMANIEEVRLVYTAVMMANIDEVRLVYMVCDDGKY